MRRLLLLACLVSLAVGPPNPVRLDATPLLALAPTGVSIVAHVSAMSAAESVTLEIVGPVSSFSAEPCATDGHWMRRSIARLEAGEYLAVVTVYGRYGVLASARQRFERG